MCGCVRNMFSMKLCEFLCGLQKDCVMVPWGLAQARSHIPPAVCLNEGVMAFEHVQGMNLINTYQV